MAYGKLLLFFSTSFALGALACMAVSLATDYWLDTAVDRQEVRSQATAAANAAMLAEMDTEPVYFSRHRGLFRTCFPGNETEWLKSDTHRTDGWCVMTPGLFKPDKPETANYGSQFKIRQNLVKAVFAFFILGLLFSLLAVFTVMAACANTQVKTLNIGALFAILGGVFVAASVGVFHGIKYLEEEKIENGYFLANIEDDANYKILIDNSVTVYGYSYILAWIGVCCGLINAMLLLCLGASERSAKEADDAKALAPYEYTMSSSHGRNKDLTMQDYMAQQAAVVGAPAYSAYPYAYPTLGYTNLGSDMYNNAFYDYESYRA